MYDVGVGVITDKLPTFKTPLEPTTMPFGEINIKLPSVLRAPLLPILVKALTIPLIFTPSFTRLMNVLISPVLYV